MEIIFAIFVENQCYMPNLINKVELRNLQIEDYKELKKSMIESYPEMVNSYWKEDHIEKLWFYIVYNG